MAISDASLRLAVKNIAAFGDTDVFPVPLEKHWFSDEPDIVFELLSKIREDYEAAFSSLPIFSSTELTNVGYFGFRSATQIEPLWNAYLLAATIEAASEIEASRQPKERVFSYRFAPDMSKGSLFASYGWRDFHQMGLQIAEKYQYVGVVDISDFYPRVYHHRLENVLRTVCKCKSEIVGVIDTLLRKLNSGNSFGLPVGGPASRILAEALLVRSDELLQLRKIEFLRFVDDYIIYGNTEDEVRSHILELSRILLDNEGLSLNRNKIRVYSIDEYVGQSVFADSTADLPKEEQQKRSFFSMHLRYDPYSETAEEDYESLKKAVKEHAVLSLLSHEIHKTPINIYSARQLVKATVFMDPDEKSLAVRGFSQQIEKLAPVFTTLARTFQKLKDDIEDDAAQSFFAAVRHLVTARQPLIGASGTLAFAIRILAIDKSRVAESALQEIFTSRELTPIIEREVIMAMGRRGANSWISDLKNRFGSMSRPWSRRALLAASYSLGDEGKHWRKSVKKHLPKHDQLLLDWISSKNNGTMWQIPL